MAKNIQCPSCWNENYLQYEYNLNDYWCTHCTVWRKQYLKQVVFKR